MQLFRSYPFPLEQLFERPHTNHAVGDLNQILTHNSDYNY